MRSIVIATLAFMTLASADSAAVTNPSCRPIRLHVIDIAGVPRRWLDRAQGEVIRLYQRIGVEIDWHEGNPAPQRVTETAKPLLLRLTIMGHPRGRMPPNVGVIFGAAPARPEDPRVASIFFEDVKRAAAGQGFDTGLVLGHTMAHELGHLLLPAYKHSREGLMRASWTNNDLLLATHGQLYFSQSEAALIRSVLLRETQPSGTISVPENDLDLRAER